MQAAQLLLCFSLLDAGIVIVDCGYSEAGTELYALLWVEV